MDPSKLAFKKICFNTKGKIAILEGMCVTHYIPCHSFELKISFCCERMQSNANVMLNQLLPHEMLTVFVKLT